MRIAIEGGGYAEACDGFYQANQDTVDTVSKLSGQLGGSGSMAGTDTGGEDWAAQYDPSAAQALQAGCDLAASLGTMANLLNASLVNHEAADGGARLSGPPEVTGQSSGDSDPSHGSVTLSAPAPPSAKGGTGDQPGWWHWLEGHLAGLFWPDADTGRLRSAGQAWTSTGDTLGTYVYDIEAASSLVSAQTSPEISHAVAACSEIKGHVTDLAQAYRDIGTACNDYAKHVDDHHQEIEDELESFIAWTVGIEAGGALLGLVTLGAGEAAAQAAEAAEVANAANKVRRILTALLELARTVAATIGRVLSRIGEIAGKLTKFVNAGVKKALVRVGGKEAVETSEKLASDAVKRRVTLRVGTKKSIQDAAPKTPKGDYVDPNTGQVIPKDGPFHYGHRPGFEWWRTQRLATKEHWTRREVIEYENNPSHFQIEDPVSNMSHRHEMPR